VIGPAPEPAHRIGLGLAVLVTVLGLSVIVAAALGPADVDPLTAWRIVASHLTPGVPAGGWSHVQGLIVWDIRIPRALLAALVGAALALVGATLQAMVRNPLADPTILGGTSGAGLGAVVVLLLGLTFAGAWSVAVAAFVGALVARTRAYSSRPPLTNEIQSQVSRRTERRSRVLRNRPAAALERRPRGVWRCATS